jgi:hypothetical protein
MKPLGFVSLAMFFVMNTATAATPSAVVYQSANRSLHEGTGIEIGKCL